MSKYLIARQLKRLDDHDDIIWMIESVFVGNKLDTPQSRYDSLGINRLLALKSKKY